MQERNIINGVMASAIMPLLTFYENLLPYIGLAIILIVVDSRFGIAAARKRGETIRTSRKWRRAINKLVDYVCWVTLAGVFGQAYGSVLDIPALAALMLLVVYGIELTSIFNNYFEYKGLHKKINVYKLFRRPDIAAAIEDTADEKQAENHENKDNSER